MDRAMTETPELFPASYQAARSRFRDELPRVQARWPAAHLARHAVAGDETTTIDWIEAPATGQQEKLLILTTGEHGIEGYVGAAMLQLFIEAYLPRLAPANTGLLLIHAINPWGMAHRRRTNAANVDLNRTFIWDAGDAPAERLYDATFNPGYDQLMPLLNPRGAVRSLAWSRLAFAARLLRALVTVGPGRLKAITLEGQYRHPQGIYFGGRTVPEETAVLMRLFRAHIARYRQILHLDMHTGYGPRYQMSLVNSRWAPRASAELAQRFAYPLVVKTTPNEFYALRGDMIDWVYTLQREAFPDKQLYATSFEFGAYGDSILAGLRSMRTMVEENRLYWHGVNPPAEARIRDAFAELYAPGDARWRAKAVADAHVAFSGILTAERFA